jgi:ribosomal protein L11 methyltransferase
VAEIRWLEVSLVVDGELAEAVAEVLDRFASNGVVVESNVKSLSDEDEGTPEGPVKVYGYLCVDEHLEENRTRLEEALWHLGQIQELPKAEFKFIEDEDWMAAWKKHYHPIEVGEKLLIVPAWLKPRNPKRIAVKIDPSMAFGTGTHPSTQLCLELLETYVRPDQPVIDVGCGSGILSIAALKLGASHALGVDIDNAAIKSTHDNARANGVEAAIETGLGSVEEILKSNFSIQQAPLVLANILAPVIIRLFKAGLADLMTPDGAIVLAGILDTQAEGVSAVAVENGLKFVEQRQMGDWVALVFKQR